MVTFAIRGMTLARHVARPVAALAAAGVLIGMAARLAWSQVPFGRLGFGTVPATHFELSGTVQLDEADSTVRTHLGRVKEYLADRQWEEAVQTLMEVMEQSGAKLLGVTERRFVSVRDYCHLQLANLPPEALALYRSRVDPMAQRWYEEGIARRDRQRLLDIVEQAFASSWGDNALYALGEMALESGDYAAARAYWEKCVPADPPAQASPTWLCVPDTDLDLAAIRARLVLASILEGSVARAEDELAQLARLHPDARGRLGGREVNYVEALTSLLAESRDWPVRERSPDWPTFAGSPARNGVASEAVDPAEVAWRVPLRPTAEAAGSIWDAEMPVGRVAEDAQKPLSYHPVVVGDLVLVSNQAEVLAIDLRTGGAAWGDRGPQIFRALSDGPARALHGAPSCLGVARSTLTAFGRRLYVRAGSPITSRPREVRLFGDAREGGYLVSLDLDAEGRLVWLVTPPEGDLSFEGSPVTDGANVYVALRRSDIQPQAHVACFDAASGQLRWQRFVCAAETPAQGILCERTHNLLTLDRETIYVNTNLGAVAALSARDGRVKWVSLYPRVREGDLLKPAPHFSRDLNPCLYYRGVLLVAPSDARRIFALDAATGQILWQTGPEVEDVVHLLGVAGGRLIASGERLYWIGLSAEDAGRVKYMWPDGHERLGYGRGVLAGDCVFWPTRDKIYVFDSATGRQKRVISLVAHGTTGGNLVIAAGYLLIAGSDGLVALRQTRGPAGTPEEKIASTRERVAGGRWTVHGGQ